MAGQKRVKTKYLQRRAGCLCKKGAGDDIEAGLKKITCPKKILRIS